VVRGRSGVLRIATYALAAIDLDGTLLRGDGSLSERTRAALQATPLEIVLVSARGPRGVREVADAAGLEGTAIASNGGMVLDLRDQSIRRIRAIETDVAIRLVETLRERLPGILFGIERESFAHEHGFSAWNWTPPPDTRIGDALELLDEPPTKLILRHHSHELEVVAAAAREILGDAASVYISGEWVVEVSAAGVNKAAALAEVCEELTVEPQHVVAFGDHLNDLPMLAWAGHAVAVENAHPDVIDAADEVTASNDQDGVAIVLERLSLEA
jgi:Cof subfamily protein (haloacid dehalogenase superfamily)